MLRRAEKSEQRSFSEAMAQIIMSKTALTDQLGLKQGAKREAGTHATALRWRQASNSQEAPLPTWLPGVGATFRVRLSARPACQHKSDLVDEIGNVVGHVDPC